jgi:hypothetical protein
MDFIRRFIIKKTSPDLGGRNAYNNNNNLCNDVDLLSDGPMPPSLSSEKQNNEVYSNNLGWAELVLRSWPHSVGSLFSSKSMEELSGDILSACIFVPLLFVIALGMLLDSVENQFPHLFISIKAWWKKKKERKGRGGGVVVYHHHDGNKRVNENGQEEDDDEEEGYGRFDSVGDYLSFSRYKSAVQNAFAVLRYTVPEKLKAIYYNNQNGKRSALSKQWKYILRETLWSAIVLSSFAYLICFCLSFVLGCVWLDASYFKYLLFLPIETCYGCFATIFSFFLVPLSTISTLITQVVTIIDGTELDKLIDGDGNVIDDLSKKASDNMRIDFTDDRLNDPMFHGTASHNHGTKKEHGAQQQRQQENHGNDKKKKGGGGKVVSEIVSEMTISSFSGSSQDTGDLFTRECRELSDTEIMRGFSTAGTDLSILLKTMCVILHEDAGCVTHGINSGAAISPKIVNATVLVAAYLKSRDRVPLSVDQITPGNLFSDIALGKKRRHSSGAADSSGGQRTDVVNDMIAFSGGLVVQSWPIDHDSTQFHFSLEDLCVVTYKDGNGICYHYLNPSNVLSSSTKDARKRLAGGAAFLPAADTSVIQQQQTIITSEVDGGSDKKRRGLRLEVEGAADVLFNSGYRNDVIGSRGVAAESSKSDRNGAGGGVSSYIDELGGLFSNTFGLWDDDVQEIKESREEPTLGSPQSATTPPHHQSSPPKPLTLQAIQIIRQIIDGISTQSTAKTQVVDRTDGANGVPSSEKSLKHTDRGEISGNEWIELYNRRTIGLAGKAGLIPDLNNNDGLGTRIGRSLKLLVGEMIFGTSKDTDNSIDRDCGGGAGGEGDGMCYEPVDKGESGKYDTLADRALEDYSRRNGLDRKRDSLTRQDVEKVLEESAISTPTFSGHDNPYGPVQIHVTSDLLGFLGRDGHRYVMDNPPIIQYQPFFDEIEIVRKIDVLTDVLILIEAFLGEREGEIVHPAAAKHISKEDELILLHEYELLGGALADNIKKYISVAHKQVARRFEYRPPSHLSMWVHVVEPRIKLGLHGPPSLRGPMLAAVIDITRGKYLTSDE